MKPEFIALGIILSAALYFFWTQRLRTDITALVVMLSLALPWPHADGKWSGILTPQEAFSGFGSVAVIMVTAMFVFSAALVRTGAAEMVGGRLFRACRVVNRIPNPYSACGCSARAASAARADSHTLLQ